MRYAVLLAVVLLAVAFWGNYPRSYEVRRVLDGDTLQLSDGRTIRIHGIDAPESGQSYGEKATAALAPLEGHRVKVQPVETDRYGRTVAKLFYEGEDIGLLMIRAGFAWHYAKYDSSRDYAGAEREAREARRGLWADPSPVPPWEWRETR